MGWRTHAIHSVLVALQMELEEGRRVAEFRRQESKSRLRRLQKQQARWGIINESTLSWVTVPSLSLIHI